MFEVSQYPIVLVLYSIGALTQAGAFFTHKKILNFCSKFSGCLAIILHSILLYYWIDLSQGQNLTEFNLLSLAIWLTAFLIMGLILYRPVGYLNVLIYPLAALSIFLAANSPSHHILQTGNDIKQFLHIILSIVTFSVLTLASLQAITLAIQEKFIKQKYFAIALDFPPIETMEKFLFELIALGTFLLTLLLVSSIYFFHSVLLQSFLQKTILTSVALLVFISLLIGRHYFGWRGKKAIYCTLSGVSIVGLIYFSSIIIMEFLP